MTNQGNRTRSIEINNLIKQVKKKEVRKQGAPSHARRPMKTDEFRLVHGILQGSKNPLWKFGINAMINFMFHLIAQIDDTTQVVLDHVWVHDHFPYLLKVKLNWSKNVNEEQDVP